MALTSLQVCMDSSDWLQGTIHDEAGMDSSSSPSGDMLTCPRPLMERRLRPPHDQALKCPRCDSTHTKFCYYNNYSLSQPRYFCKTCRRYWTKGGTLRNIPVGGGCRKNKKVSSKNKNNGDHHPHLPHLNASGGSGSSLGAHNQTDLQLSFPAEVQLSHLTGLLGHHGSPSFMEGKYNNNALPFEFMDGSMRSHDFMGSGGDHFGMIGGGFGDQHHHGLIGHHAGSNFHNSFSNSPYGMSLDGNSGGGLGQYMDSVACQRLMLPYEVNEDQNNNNAIDVKPNTKLLSLEWQHQQQQDQGSNNNNNCSDSYGGLGGGYQHLNGLGSWSGLMNGYGSSTTNPLV